MDRTSPDALDRATPADHGTPVPRTWPQRPGLLLTLGLTLLFAACTGTVSPATSARPKAPASPAAAATNRPAPSTVAPLPSTTASTAAVASPRPSPSMTLGSSSPAPTGPAGARVDLTIPPFSNPTEVTNPLFPKRDLHQVVQLGVEGPDQLRFEATQLPETKLVEWNGQQIETRVTHFVAYSNGRLIEVAYDFYAQADDGSVWYFGENVDNYQDGVLADHNGTWLAGRDGPPGMIMPADPKVGDVYRPENIPGSVFEEVTVTAVGETVAGPRGPITGAMRMKALLLDGTVEEKVYAPGYGEFQAKVASLDESYTLVLAVPADASTGVVPAELAILWDEARRVFDGAAGAGASKQAAAASTDAMTAAWKRLGSANQPKGLADQMSGALDSLKAAATGQKPAATRQAALDVAWAALDLRLRHTSIPDVDLARLDVWGRQLLLDADAGRKADVAGDIVAIGTIWDRTRGAVNDAAGRTRIDADVKALATRSSTDPGAAASLARTLRDHLLAIVPG